MVGRRGAEGCAAVRAPDPFDLESGEGPRRATVMGLGLFGGGLAVARFLSRRGTRVTVTDVRPAAQLEESLARLPPDCRLVLGRHEETDFTRTELVVANPAVKPDSRWLAMARSAGVVVETEISLFLSLCRARSIGVTGSNGKTTTATLLAAMCEQAGLSVRLGGNMGISLLEQVDAIAPDEQVILELSSFQLHYLGERALGPDGAVVLNVTPNHLDWHPTMDHYLEAKRQIVGRADWVVLNAEDHRLEAWVPRSGRRARPDVTWFGGEPPGSSGWEADGNLLLSDGTRTRLLMPAHQVPLPGRFNRLNVLAAALAACRAGAEPEAIAAAVRGFRPVRHRLERVVLRGGVSYWDDSVSTTPESTRAALEAFAPRTAVFLIGGRDKGCSLGDLLEELARSAAGVVFIGEVGPRLADLYRRTASPGAAPAVQAGDLETAVREARRLTPAGGAVVLSPGFPSYDWFRNFVERGECFGGVARGADSWPEDFARTKNKKGEDAGSQAESGPVR